MTPTSAGPRRFVVREHRPVRVMALGILLGTCLGATALLFGGLNLGVLEIPRFEDAGKERILERHLLERHISELSEENDVLATRLATLSQQRQVEVQAQSDISAYLRELQGEISALKQEVAFYRGIVTGSRGRGFEVQSFTVVEGREGGVYRFRVVLTRDSKDDKVQRGFVAFSVDGEREGKAERLSLLSLTGRDEPGYEFRFRFYQKIEGKLEVPAGFTPRVVNVEITGADGAVSGVKRSFDWPGTSG